jgi:translation initiation factor 1
LSLNIKRPSVGGLVYSTSSGRMCPGCRRPAALCNCRRDDSPPPPSGAVRISRESGGRAGKTVTVIKGLALPAPALVELARQFKATCGTGGTVKDGAIELQGDHCEAVAAALRKQGRQVKRAGG